jgi:hypothetical protein
MANDKKIENSSARSKASIDQNTNKNSAGIIVLQWLTYAFWGWLLIGVSVLIFSTIGFFITKNETEFTAYGLAATLVLLCIASITDYFYSKIEPKTKNGAAVIVMVIHAVIFALFCIGYVITGVLAIVNGLLDDFNEGNRILIFSSFLIAPVYFLVFLRTLLPKKITNLQFLHRILLIVICLILTVLTISGPVYHRYKTKNDRLIEANILDVTISISSIAASSGKLPDDLNVVAQNNSEGVTDLINSGLLQYQPNTKKPGIGKYNNYDENTNLYAYYTLCATFTAEKNTFRSPYDRYSSSEADEDGYRISDYDFSVHDAGKQCYKIRTAIKD